MQTSITVELQRIRTAWEEFIVAGDIDPSIIRPLIEESWKRSRESGVDPYDDKCFVRLPNDEFEERLVQSKELIETAYPYMRRLHELVHGSGFRVDLTDNEGCLLKMIGDKEILQEAFLLDFLPGCVRNERQVGTNGIAIAIATDSAIQVVGAEHYNINLHRWTCSAAPIHASDGHILGTLNMTGPCNGVHKHTLGMVVATVQAIEKQLSLHESAQQLTIAKEFLETITETISDGLVATDNNGLVQNFNLAASRILELKASEVIGRHVTYALSRHPSLLASFNDALDRGIQDKEVLVRRKQGTVRCLVTVRQIRDNMRQKVGNLMIISRMEDIKRLFYRMVGAQAKFSFEDIVGNDSKLVSVIDIARAAAKTSAKVLIQGETGTGKELFAQSIHRESARRDGPFLAINCAAVPRELIESELFGYDEGAFTGARQGGKPGKFELAEGGTLFLDEIESMPQEMQAKILRVIENGQLIRVGGSEVINVDVRIIAACNKDLAREVEKGRFRADLLYRLNTVTIRIPPLRQRGDDIVLLANVFLKRLSDPTIYEIEGFSNDALEILIDYHYPGNVRELQNIVERAIVFAKVKGLSNITADCLPEELRAGQAEEFSVEMSIRPFSEVEYEMIQDALVKTDGNISLAAKALGIGRNTLYRKVKKYDIDVQ